MYKYKNLEITKYLHDGFRINAAGKMLYIDPFKIPENQPKADFIFISHEHYDHLDVESISKILKDETVVVGNKLVKAGLSNLNLKNFVEISVGETKELDGFKVTARAAYNINKFREEGRPFHPKENGGLGFQLEFSTGEIIYHIGDSDFIPEMNELSDVNIDVLMIPVSGTYVMTADEASEAVNSLNPKVVIPMHFDSGFVGSANDVEVLRGKVKSEVVVLDPVK